MPSAVSRFLINRNVVLLALAQALSNSLQTMGITTTPLAAFMMLGADKSLATLPLVFTHLGLMSGTIPASLFMDRFGRRAGFTVGSLIGMLAGAVGVYAVYQQSFWLLCLTAYLQGISVSCAWYYRFAAADAAPPDLRARAISLVLFGGILSGVFGAESAKWAKDLLAPVTFAGVYVMYGVICAANLALLAFLDIPKPTREERAEPARPLSVIAQQPAFIVAVISSMMGYGVMTALMSATPLAMQACGFTFEQGATVIQFHAISMFAPALFTGHLINRYGVLPIICTGAVALIGAVLVAMARHRVHELPVGQRAGRNRLELLLHRRHDAADDGLPTVRAGEDAGRPRLPRVFDDGSHIGHGGCDPRLGRVGFRQPSGPADDRDRDPRFNVALRARRPDRDRCESAVMAAEAPFPATPNDCSLVRSAPRPQRQQGRIRTCTPSTSRRSRPGA